MKEDRNELNQPIASFVKDLKLGKSGAITEIYDANYAKIESFLTKHHGSKEDAKDVFQEAMTILWRRLKLNQFNPKTKSQLYGYLFGVARNKWMDHLRSNRFKKTEVLDKINLDIEDGSPEQGKEYELDLKIDQALQALENLDEACKSLLTEFYFQKKKLGTIASSLNIDQASARNKKYRCMQKLKVLVARIESQTVK